MLKSFYKILKNIKKNKRFKKYSYYLAAGNAIKGFFIAQPHMRAYYIILVDY